MDRISDLHEEKLNDVCALTVFVCEKKDLQVRSFPLQHFKAENLKVAPMEGIDMDKVNSRVDEQLELWAKRDEAAQDSAR
jgi:hypothetical protein